MFFLISTTADFKIETTSIESTKKAVLSVSRNIMERSTETVDESNNGKENISNGFAEQNQPQVNNEEISKESTESLKKKEVIYIGDGLQMNGGNSNPGGDLQASFRKFREQKLKEKKLMKFYQEQIAQQPRTNDYKDDLREKFIEQAKKYIGVPYARRFQNQEEPVAPLYLDCCGLIRKVLWDLQGDFGFLIGKWNQAYQMDTLPVVLEEKDLKPGDLIFYEGRYYSSRSKPQKHNNVHVEIYLGGETGEATIGSRYHKGKVSLFPSYKFTSTTWELVRYHFRSLDTWLEGACKSCCPDHPWILDTSLAYVQATGKKSIFAEDDEINADQEEVVHAEVEEEDEDVNADAYEEGDEENEEKGVVRTSAQRSRHMTETETETEEGEEDNNNLCADITRMVMVRDISDNAYHEHYAEHALVGTKHDTGTIHGANDEAETEEGEGGGEEEQEEDVDMIAGGDDGPLSENEQDDTYGTAGAGDGLSVGNSGRRSPNKRKPATKFEIPSSTLPTATATGTTASMSSSRSHIALSTATTGTTTTSTGTGTGPVGNKRPKRVSQYRHSISGSTSGTTTGGASEDKIVNEMIVFALEGSPKGVKPSPPIPIPTTTKTTTTTYRREVSKSLDSITTMSLTSSAPHTATTSAATTAAAKVPPNVIISHAKPIHSKPSRISAATSAATSTTTSTSTVSLANTFPRTYYVSKSNGWKLVKASLDAKGWCQLPFEYQFSSKFHLKWVERRSQIDYRAHQPGQLVCHIPNNDCITTKIGLLTTLRDYYCRLGSGSSGGQGKLPRGSGKPTVQHLTGTPMVVSTHPPWVPMTFDLDVPSDLTALFHYLDTYSPPQTTTSTTTVGIPTAQSANDLLWIYKPSCNNRGRGIKVVQGLKELQMICYGGPSSTSTSSSSSSGGVTTSTSTTGGAGGATSGKECKDSTNGGDSGIAPLKGIIQEYLLSPLLIPPMQFKFDIRCYLLLARTYPTVLAYYHPGYCRLALKPYMLTGSTGYTGGPLDSAILDDTSMHLTNASIQKKDPIYQQYKDMQIQSVSEIAQRLADHGFLDSAEYIRSGTLDHEIKSCMVDVLKACHTKLLKKHGYFDLLGCDFMLTSTNKLYLLEMNTNPALSLDNHVLEDLLPRVVDGAIELVLQCQGPDIPDLSAPGLDFPNQSCPSQYQLLLDESSGWMYNQQTQSV